MEFREKDWMKGRKANWREREEMKERFRVKRIISEWEKGRMEYFKKRDLKIIEVKRRKEEKERHSRRMMKTEGEWKDRKKQKKERWEKIKESRFRIKECRFSKRYKEVKEEGIPEYLKKRWGKSRWKNCEVQIGKRNEGREILRGRREEKMQIMWWKGRDGNMSGKNVGIGKREEGAGQRH